MNILVYAHYAAPYRGNFIQSIAKFKNLAEKTAIMFFLVFVKIPKKGQKIG